MTRGWLVLILLLLLSRSAFAACGGSSPSLTASTWADVSSCNTAAVDGDTITLLTAGSPFHANSTITVSHAITITGQAACTLDGNGRPSSCPVIVNDDTSSTGAKQIFDVTRVANKITKIAELEFDNGTRGTTDNTNGLIYGHGANTDNRRLFLDHIYCKQLHQFCVQTDTVYGGIFRSHIDQTGNSMFSYNRMTAYDGYDFGDGAWAAADQFGTDQFWFIENNLIEKSDASPGFTSMDGDSAFRIAPRYNTITNCLNVDGHGTENGQRKRGMRAADIGHNTFTCDGSNSAPTYNRGGVVLIHDNTFTNYGGASMKFEMLNPRTIDSFTPGGFAGGGAHGTNPWDTQTGGIVASGTVTSAGTRTLTNTGASFTTTGNGLKGYTVRKTSGCTLNSLTWASNTITGTCASAHGWSAGQDVGLYNINQMGYEGHWTTATASGSTFTLSTTDGYTRISPATAVSGLSMMAVTGQAFGDISSNTATSLTWRPSLYSGIITGADLSFQTNDTYEVRQNVNVTDAPGMGQSTLVTGNMPAVPGGWTQAVSPWYAWSNTRDGGTASNVITPDSYQSISGTHYVNGTAKPGYSEFTYPHPLVTCGAVTCGGVPVYRYRSPGEDE